LNLVARYKLGLKLLLRSFIQGHKTFGKVMSPFLEFGCM
jgi:hypothetical protein